MSALRYPLELGKDGGQDYVVFKPMPYRANAADPGNSSNDDGFAVNFRDASSRVGRVGSGGGGTMTYGAARGLSAGAPTGHTGAAAPPSSDAKSVVLYMPNSTPPVGNSNNWADSGDTFQGPFGAIKKNVGVAGANAIMDVTGGGGGGGLTGGGLDVGRTAGDIGKLLEQSMKGAPGAVGQVGIQATAGLLGTNANALTAISRGQVYNNNVELLYQSPGLRTFSFQFDFIPKSLEEAEIVNQIILNFKMWASPQENSSMFEVPYVWQVSYKTGSQDNKNMNKFKKAALKNITVQANASTDMHVAHPGGVPIITSIGLDFMEVDVITRQDHFAAGGQGF